MESGDEQLRALLRDLHSGLVRLDLAATRRQLALLELHAERVDADRPPGEATFYARSCRAMFALTEGDLVGAATMTDEAHRIAVTLESPGVEAVVRTLRNDRARQLRDREGMASGATDCERAGSPADLAEAAVLWLESGNTFRAGTLVDRLAERLELLPDDDVRPLVVVRVCEAAVGTGRRMAVRTCVSLLQDRRHQGVVAPAATAFCGVVDDYLALATGDRELGEQARLSYERLGAWWWARRRALVLRPSTSFPRVIHLHPSHRDSAGAQWCVGADGHTRVVTAMPGLEYLRRLLQHPHRDLAAADLDEGGADPRRRVAVRQAIAAALSRLEMVDPELAAELRSTIRTGLTCRYDPDPLQPTAWHLEVDVAHAAYGG